MNKPKKENIKALPVDCMVCGLQHHTDRAKGVNNTFYALKSLPGAVLRNLDKPVKNTIQTSLYLYILLTKIPDFDRKTSERGLLNFIYSHNPESFFFTH